MPDPMTTPDEDGGSGDEPGTDDEDADEERRGGAGEGLARPVRGPLGAVRGDRDRGRRARPAEQGWIVANLDPGEGMVVLGEWLRLVHGQNSGILFGMLPQSAPIFAVVSIGVTALIVVYHAKAGQGIVTTIALGLLLGGAIGNLVDRLRYGYVVDFVDMGIGSWRFYTYNVADACITTAIVLLIVMAVFPRVAEWGADD